MEQPELAQGDQYACPAITCTDTFEQYHDYYEHYRRAHT